jgi:hypothetical protein
MRTVADSPVPAPAVAVLAPGAARRSRPDRAPAPACCVCDAPIADALVATIVGPPASVRLLGLHPACAVAPGLELLADGVRAHGRQAATPTGRLPRGR